MKKNYQIKGMSCSGCVSKVKEVLLQVPGVLEAEVNLNPQGAVITMDKSIALDELQTQLKKAGHYIIEEVI